LKLNLAIGFGNDPPLATPSSRIVTGMEGPDDDITMGQMRQKMCAEKRQEEQFALSKKGEGPIGDVEYTKIEFVFLESLHLFCIKPQSCSWSSQKGCFHQRNQLRDTIKGGSRDWESYCWRNG